LYVIIRPMASFPGLVLLLILRVVFDDLALPGILIPHIRLVVIDFNKEVEFLGLIRSLLQLCEDLLLEGGVILAIQYVYLMI
jgi:hypothetical protein